MNTLDVADKLHDIRRSLALVQSAISSPEFEPTQDEGGGARDLLEAQMDALNEVANAVHPPKSAE